MPRAPAAAGPLVTAHKIVCRTPCGEVVLDGLSLSLPRARTGLVGPNGAGKTTLARILAGEIEPDEGSVVRPRGLGTAYLPQSFDHLRERTVGSLMGCESGLDPSAAAAFARLGMACVDLSTTLGALSGGEATRVVLASLLVAEPDLLILDEPTNNLDAASRAALADVVRAWRGGLLVISHDRRLLSVMDQIVELTPRGLRTFGGGYDLYREQRETLDAAAEHAVAEAQRDLRRLRRAAAETRERQARRDARGRARRAEGRTPKIVLNTMRDASQATGARLRAVHEDRIDGALGRLAEAKHAAAEPRKFAIQLADPGLPPGKRVLDVEEVSFAYPGARPLFEGLSLRMTGPERIALAGPSGAGKSTLLRLITGALRPGRGTVRLGVDRWAMLDQHAALLDPARSILATFRAMNPALSDEECRRVLAGFLFRGERAHLAAGSLSGGERVRAALACVLGGVRPPQLLILDEPANHLDLESLAHVESALRSYRGALLVVSHDAAFLEALGVDRTAHLGPPGGRG